MTKLSYNFPGSWVKTNSTTFENTRALFFTGDGKIDNNSEADNNYK